MIAGTPFQYIVASRVWIRQQRPSRSAEQQTSAKGQW